MTADSPTHRRFGAHQRSLRQREPGKPDFTLDVLFEPWPGWSIKHLLCAAEEAGLLAAARETRAKARRAAEAALRGAAGLCPLERMRRDRAAWIEAGPDLTPAEAARFLGGVTPDLDRVARGMPDDIRASRRPKKAQEAEAAEEAQRVVLATALWLAALAMADEPPPAFVAPPPLPEGEEPPALPEHGVPLPALTLPDLAVSARAAYLLGRIVQLTEPRLTGAEWGGLEAIRRTERLNADEAGAGAEARAEGRKVADAWKANARRWADEPRLWAALSASGMAGLILPPGPGLLYIAPDNDPAGMAAANALANRAAGWTVKHLIPPAEGQDWNDVLQGRAVA